MADDDLQACWNDVNPPPPRGAPPEPCPHCGPICTCHPNRYVIQGSTKVSIANFLTVTHPWGTTSLSAEFDFADVPPQLQVHFADALLKRRIHLLMSGPVREPDVDVDRPIERRHDHPWWRRWLRI